MKKQFNIYSLGIIAAATLWAAPTHAQWLVQDNNLYELIQTEVVKEQLKPLNDKFEISGNAVTPYQASGTVDDQTSSFNQLVFPLSTNTLLDPEKHKENAKTFEQDAKTYISEDTVPNCNLSDKKVRPTLYNNCLYVRNIMGGQLRALRTISQTLEGRDKKLHALMQNNKYDTPAELQKKQYEISALQAMIANDTMRLQTALAAFNTTRDMYQLRYTEALQGKLGKKEKGKNASKPTLLQTAGRAVLIGALKSASDADNNKRLKEKSSTAGSWLDKVLGGGLEFLGK